MGSDVQTLITEHIDLWASAIQKKKSAGRGSSKKHSLYGIKKLRELILELAVRGKLVPQDPNDEPASVLLERIAEERDRLIEENKLKRPKQLPVFSASDIPFDLPSGWEPCQFGNICDIERGGSPRPIKSYLTDSEDGLNWIKIGDTDKGGKYINGTAEKIRPEGIHKTRQVFPGDFLLTNSMSFGRPYITNIEGCIHDGWLRIHPPKQLNKDYLYILLSSPFVYRAFSASAAGAVVQNLNSGKVRGLVFGLPPLPEQVRIVEKVDELMALCDQLEAQTENNITAHQVLVETLLGTLTQSQNADELAENWQRLAEHFDTLFTTEHSIDQLKQTILQLAVMGKLVPQDPNDEPASVLLERIASEKEQLIKDKKIKKQKALLPIAEDEKPFALPKGWGWTRLDDICYGITSGSTPPKEEFREGLGIPYLKVYNIRNQSIDFEYNPQYVCPNYHLSKLKRSILFPGDVVMNIVGPPLGKVAVIPDDYPEWNCNQAITFFRPIETKLNTYIYTYLKAGTFLSSIELIGTAGQDNISVTKSRSIVLPLPTLEEQGRIVAKVEQLMTICDQLKARLQESQQTQLFLAEAIADQALQG